MTAVDLISQFSPSYHAELALQAGAQALEMLVCSGLIFPSGNRIHSLQHLKAFLELLFSTLNVPKCALMNRSTQILPFGRVHFRVKHMKAWQTSRNQGSPVKMKEKKSITGQLCVLVNAHVLLHHTEHSRKLKWQGLN